MVGKEVNDLRTFFDSRREGPGIWKWLHYFDIYERHFAKFRNKPLNILEIGIYSGGSLDMWREYFGPECMIYGVDVQPDCTVYERAGVKVFIGDQSKADFWREFKTATPMMDIIIDDGSHKPTHQITTLEALLPHLNPGGVYLCEDVHGYPESAFAMHVHSMAHRLNEHSGFLKNKDDDDRRLVKPTTQFQSDIAGIHLYPYVVLIEKNTEPVAEFVAPKRGTEWQPFKP